MMLTSVLNITEAKLHHGYGLKQLIFTKGTIIVEDRAYFDFDLMLQRIKAEILFVTLIKTSTVYQAIKELELLECSDQDILKDEIISLTVYKAVDVSINNEFLLIVHGYKED